MTRRDAVAEWREMVAESIAEMGAKVDRAALRVSWSAFVDSLCKGGAITPRQYDRWAAPSECESRVAR